MCLHFNAVDIDQEFEFENGKKKLQKPNHDDDDDDQLK